MKLPNIVRAIMNFSHHDPVEQHELYEAVTALEPYMNAKTLGQTYRYLRRKYEYETKQGRIVDE